MPAVLAEQIRHVECPSADTNDWIWMITMPCNLHSCSCTSAMAIHAHDGGGRCMPACIEPLMKFVL